MQENMGKYRKNIEKIAALLLAAVMCGCTRIPDLSLPDSSESTDSSDTEITEPVKNEYLRNEFTIEKQDYAVKLNAEGGVVDIGEIVETEEDEDPGEPFDGKGYARIKSGGTLSHVVTASTPQHYRIIIAARSEKGAPIKLRVAETVQGTYYVPPADSGEFKEGEYDFKYYAIDNIFLPAGANSLKFTVEDGGADIDYIFVESSDAVKSSCYNIGNSCANPNSSGSALDLMQYLTEQYGKKTLTAQNVSVGTNAEIDAVYKETGRYPAIRAGELALAVLGDEDSAERTAKDIELAAEWGKDGGIVSYTWHWYSPNSLHGTAPKDFRYEGSFDGQSITDLALLSGSSVADMLDKGLISEELAALIGDIDKVAEQLKALDKQNIPVLFEPMPDADSGLYWWGNNAEDYKTLWMLMFDRMCIYHNIKGLIWIWNGSGIDYYPGDRYVDIIGQSFYEGSKVSFAGRFSALSEMNTARKIQAVTACDVLPSIDYMYRDNAMWLWAAAGSGQYVMTEHGVFTETYNSRSSLNYFYNHELTVTKDELRIN